MMWQYMLALLGLGIFFLFRWYWERLTVPDLLDKYVLITGCGSGFGNLLAHQLDHLGLRVLAACHTEKSANLLKEATSQRLQTVVVELSDSDSVASMVQWVKQQVGSEGLWGLVNNAATSNPTAVNEWLTKQDFQRVLNINLLGAIDVTLSLTPLVRKARGRIVNMSSICGRITLVGGGYCISKFGIEAFSDSLRRELSPFGVKVILVEPGFFQTAISSHEALYDNFLHSFDQSSQEVQDVYGKPYLAHVLCCPRVILPHSLSVRRNLSELKNKCSSNLSIVTDCMQHGLTAQHPRTRYSPGWDAKLIYLPLSYCPTTFVDAVLGRDYANPAQNV